MSAPPAKFRDRFRQGRERIQIFCKSRLPYPNPSEILSSHLCPTLRTEFSPRVQFCAALGAVGLLLNISTAFRAELDFAC
jgi:hypothetical protein